MHLLCLASHYGEFLGCLCGYLCGRSRTQLLTTRLAKLALVVLLPLLVLVSRFHLNRAILHIVDKSSPATWFGFYLLFELNVP